MLNAGLSSDSEVVLESLFKIAIFWAASAVASLNDLKIQLWIILPEAVVDAATAAVVCAAAPA